MKLLLLLLLLFIVVLCVILNIYAKETFNNDNLEESCKNNDDKCLKSSFFNDITDITENNGKEFMYNLNDSLHGYPGSADYELIKYNCKNNDKYKNTLLCMYLNKYKNRDGNKKYRLYKLMKENNLLNMKLDNVLVIHLRLGDAFSHWWAKKNNWDKINIEKYEKINIPENITEVHIFSGSHKQLSDDDLNKSINHIKDIKKYFENKNLKTKLFLGGDVDDSFIYMCNSKYFIKSSGGFSDTISKIVTLNNGRCI
jgi:cell division protein FtsI/penicillin-binding protein 2